MSREQYDAFLDRRARVLEKHAACDPRWQAYQRERRPRPLRLLMSLVIGLALLAGAGKTVLLAHHGAAGYQQVTAPLAAAVADLPVLPALIAPDPGTEALAAIIAPERQVSHPVPQAAPEAADAPGADTE